MLLQRLILCGIMDQIVVDGNFLNTIVSYLTCRKQVIVVHGVESDVLDVKAGVPQRSRLGSLLFYYLHGLPC